MDMANHQETVRAGDQAPLPRGRPRAGGLLVRQLRLVSGLALFTYLSTHLANHALGLISLQAMETGRLWFLALWRHPLGTWLCYTAAATHVALALWALYHRRHLRLPVWEACQLGLGFLIPLLLVPHIMGTRVAYEAFAAQDTYTRVVLALWHLSPENGLRQTLALCIAWLHGCVGLHFWLRFRAWYRYAVPWLFALALLLPVLALLGFAQAGKEVAVLAQQPEWVPALLAATRAPGPEARAWLQHWSTLTQWGFVGSLLLTLGARGLRHIRTRHRRTVQITYPNRQVVTVPVGVTVLEASRLAHLPHASICGGRGRCSTCRVRIGHGLAALPPPGTAEQRLLERLGAAPNVRLACQLRPTQAVSVTPLVPATLHARDAASRPTPEAGREQEIAVFFADLRGFTRLAEHKLPYDVVFFLNRYFDTVGSAIAEAGGIANQFTGDGVMALFGIDSSPEDACRQALSAAHQVIRRLHELSATLVDELDTPLRMGIGIHVGPAVVGRMGHGVARYLTAVGDTVHVASRLQDATKDYDAQLVLSELVAARAGIHAASFPRHEITVRNRREPLVVRVVQDVRMLPVPASKHA